MKIRIASLVFYLFLGFVAYASFSTKDSLPSDLVDLSKVVPGLSFDLKYATANNFTGKKIYSKSLCFARREVARQLASVQKELSKKGLGLKIWDAYRPHSSQQDLWNAVSDKRYVADPKKGSNHNRGAAIDATLVSLNTGEELEMPTCFDCFTVQAHSSCRKGISKVALKNRAFFHDVMKAHGFSPISTEWWHFNYKKCKEYSVLDISFEDLIKQGRVHS